MVLLQSERLSLIIVSFIFQMTNYQYTNIYSILDKYLLSNINTARKNIQNIIFKESLTLTVIESNNLKFASDLNHTIQLIVYDKNIPSQNDVPFQTTPFNKNPSNFYRKLDEKKFNLWQAYNCKDQSLLQTKIIQSSSPYTPQFYFGKGFKEFKSMKALDNDVSLPPSLNNKIINIQQWRIRIVNISESGWYAPILEAAVWKFDRLINRQNFKNPKVKQIMQSMWQKDVKKVELPPTINYRYFYSKMKTLPKTDVSKLSLFSNDDKKQKIKYNNDKIYHHIPIRSDQQYLYLHQKIHKKQEINIKVIEEKPIQKPSKILLKKTKPTVSRDQTINKQVPRRRTDQLWSSEQEVSEEEQQLEQQQIQNDENQEQEQDYQQHDFITNTYLKYIKTQKKPIK